MTRKHICQPISIALSPADGGATQSDIFTDMPHSAITRKVFVQHVYRQPERVEPLSCDMLIDGASKSYIGLLSQIKKAYQSYRSLHQMPLELRQLVCGIVPRRVDPYMYLGNMNSAVQLREALNKNAPLCRDISDIIDALPSAPHHVTVDALGTVVRELYALRDVRMGVMSRLVATKRPDMCLPLTGTSLLRAQEAFGNMFEGGKIKDADDYMLPLEHIYSTLPFYSAAKPLDMRQGAL